MSSVHDFHDPLINPAPSEPLQSGSQTKHALEGSGEIKLPPTAPQPPSRPIALPPGRNPMVFRDEEDMLSKTSTAPLTSGTAEGTTKNQARARLAQAAGGRAAVSSSQLKKMGMTVTHHQGEGSEPITAENLRENYGEKLGVTRNQNSFVHWLLDFKSYFLGDEIKRKDVKTSYDNALDGLKENPPKTEQFQKFFSQNSLWRLAQAGIIKRSDIENLCVINEILQYGTQEEKTTGIPLLLKEVRDSYDYSSRKDQIKLVEDLVKAGTGGISNTFWGDLSSRNLGLMVKNGLIEPEAEKTILVALKTEDPNERQELFRSIQLGDTGKEIVRKQFVDELRRPIEKGDVSNLEKVVDNPFYLQSVPADKMSELRFALATYQTSGDPNKFETLRKTLRELAPDLVQDMRDFVSDNVHSSIRESTYFLADLVINPKHYEKDQKRNLTEVIKEFSALKTDFDSEKFRAFYQNYSMRRLSMLGVIDSKDIEKFHAIYKNMSEGKLDPKTNPMDAIAFGPASMDNRIGNLNAQLLPFVGQLSKLERGAADAQTPKEIKKLLSDILEQYKNYNVQNIAPEVAILVQDAISLLGSTDFNDKKQIKELSKAIQSLMSSKLGASAPIKINFSKKDPKALGDLIIQLIGDLDTTSLKKEGLWRIRGNDTEILRLEQESKGKPKADGNFQSHEASVRTGYIKAALKNFPKSETGFIPPGSVPKTIITGSLETIRSSDMPADQKAKAISGEIDRLAEERVKQIQAVYAAIGPDKAKVLDAILKHFSKVAAESDTNKMTASNVAIAASGSLIQHNKDNNSDFVNALVQSWIEVADRIPSPT